MLEITLIGLLSVGNENPTVSQLSSSADIWTQTLKQLPLSIKALLQQHGKLVALEAGTATIKISSEALKNKVPVARLESALSQVVGTNTRLQLIS